MTEGAASTLREGFASLQPEKLKQRQRARLAAMVSHARGLSPYYRDLYRSVH